jgi:hypothetical protein
VASLFSLEASAKKIDLLKDSASDGNIGGEWALLVNVLSLNSLSGCLEA